MATLKIEVASEYALTTTQMKGIEKGVEAFYYVGLFSDAKPYAGTPEPWRSWLKMGFSTSLREAPSAAAQFDRVIMTVRPDGKVVHLDLSGANKSALSDLQAVLEIIEGLRGSLRGRNDEERDDALEANQELQKKLLVPLMDSLKRSGCRPDEVDEFMAMVRRGLVAMTDNEITTIRFFPN